MVELVEGRTEVVVELVEGRAKVVVENVLAIICCILLNVYYSLVPSPSSKFVVRYTTSIIKK